MTRHWDDFVDEAIQSLVTDHLMYNLEDGTLDVLRDEVWEVADGMTPIYNHDRLELVMDNPDLWCEPLEDSGLIKPDDISICNLAGILIFSKLEQAMQDWLYDNEDDIQYMFDTYQGVHGSLDEWKDMDEEEYNEAFGDILEDIEQTMYSAELQKKLVNALEDLLLGGKA